MSTLSFLAVSLHPMGFICAQKEIAVMYLFDKLISYLGAGGLWHRLMTSLPFAQVFSSYRTGVELSAAVLLAYKSFI